MKLIVFCLLFICDLINSKRTSPPGYNKLKTKNLSECQRCKVLTDSFNYWLDKTSRGKYEGGDAAWEESKLKSYSRSEIRLVEIQEGLCSELKKHQDYCYSLAEDAESVLEKWWFLDNPQSVDLYTWLCIENLQYCCPKNHYGDSCSPCPLSNNQLCGGHGRCDGEGTRKGNGTCLCQKGYTGKLCELCDSNFYNTKSACEPCHKACDECSGEGDNACKKCKTGWEMISGVCTDINECLDPSVCQIGQYCVNGEGTFACRMCDMSCKTCIGEGQSNCTTCEPNSVLWSGNCIDDKQKSDILRNTLRRAALYSGLLLIAFFVFRYSKSLASLTILIIALYMYISEKAYNMSMLDVLFNLYLS